MKISKNLKYGATALVLTVVFIVLIVFANVLIGWAGDTWNLKVDMTADNRYDVSQDTIDLLAGVQNNITIYALASEDEMFAVDTFGPSVTEILKRYKVLSNGKVDVQFIDLVKNPTFLQGFDIGDISKYSLIVKSDTAYRLVTFDELLYWRQYTEETTDSLTAIGLDMERTLASAITYCDTGVTRKALILAGKGEELGDKFATFLKNNNFEYTTANLATSDIPDGTDLIVINNPTKDYSAEELKKLDVYLNEQYGKLIVGMGVESSNMTNLKMYLDELGVTYEPYAVYDTKYALTGTPDAVLSITTSADILSRFSQSNTTIIMPEASPLSTRDVTGSNWSRQDLLASSTESSFAKEIDLNRVNDEIVKEDGDLSGAFITSTLLTKQPIVDTFGDNTYGKILCLGSGQFLSDTYMDSSKYSNSAFMSVVMSDFFGGGDLSRFKVKPFVESDLVTLESEKTIILTVLLAIPILMVIIGVVIWMRRKNM